MDCVLCSLLVMLNYHCEIVPVGLINQRIGINEPADSIASLLTRVCLPSEVVEGVNLFQF